jgi:hypothetical protein
MTLLVAILSFLYSAVGAFGALSYIPQFRKFWRDPVAAMYSPVSTWSIWVAQTTTYFLYATFVNHDALFICLTFINMVANQACFAALLWRRHQFIKAGKKLPANRRRPLARNA